MSPPRRHLTALGAAGVAAAVLATPLGTATAVPTCVDVPQALCGDRVVAEALQSQTFLQHGTEFVPALHAIAAINPELVTVFTLAELTGDPAHVSAGGRDLHVVRVTNAGPDAPVSDPAKRQAVVSLSVHGGESAGREGGIRYLEDLARWSRTTPDRPLHAGDTAVPLSALFDQVELWLGFTNPDGWAAGDVLDPSGVTFARGNAHGVDLNREFPTVGWTRRSATALSEPEARGWAAFVAGLPNLTTASDIHGENTTATGSFADLMLPAGQWDPRQQAQQRQLAEHVVASVERKFADDGVVLQDVMDVAGGPFEGTGVATRPATYATAYDIVGYDDSGFMGDWFVRQGAIEIDAENFLSNLVPSNAWVPVLEQAHVAAVRGIIEAVAVEAVLTDRVQAHLHLGRVAHVADPARVSSTDLDGFGFVLRPGESPEHYDVSRMRYFEELDRHSDVDVTGLDVGTIAAGDVDSFELDSIVVADVAYPASLQGAYDRAAYRRTLTQFVVDGGQLVVTDGAMPLLADLGLVAHADVATVYADGGHMDFGALDHPWEADLGGIASQTYYEVPLGFPPRDSAPNHGVRREAWEAAGGVTVATVGDGSQALTGLGEMAVGDGRVAIFGAVLPQPTEAHPHLHGLADHAVTITGGSVLHAILAFERSGVDPLVPPRGDR